MKYNILIVEDEKNQANVISKILIKNGYNTYISPSVESAVDSVRANRIDLVLSDYKLPDGSGMDVIASVRSINPEIPIVVMTAFGDVDIAVKCLKNGAADFLTKPLDLAELDRIVHKLIQNRMLVEEVTRLRREVETAYSASNICGTSDRLTAEIRRAVKVAPSDTNVMINGESGTGKELFANLIHYNSQRHEKSFIKVNCSAIPADLIESELFGHVKGSFTGAFTDKTGKFEAADGGTIFLDEIGELPVNLQAKLLRVIQEREIEPVGSVKVKKIDVRIVSATNRRLEEAIARREFREDLYYRLNTVVLTLPALRERKEDIPLLAKFFINKFNASLRRAVKDISSDALDALMKYGWPGNVRELQNVVENTMVLMGEREETIYLRHLPEKVSGGFRPAISAADIHAAATDGEGGPVDQPIVSGACRADIASKLEVAWLRDCGFDLSGYLDGIEKIALIWALEKSGGTKTEMARFFGVDEKSIRNKLKKYNL